MGAQGTPSAFAALTRRFISGQTRFFHFHPPQGVLQMSEAAAFHQVSVLKAANVYFDGKCISHTVLFPNGSRKTIGVILPSTLAFNTGEPEVMETVAGSCRVRLKGESEWKAYGAGESFHAPGNSSFEIEVTGEPYHYVCYYG
jgi:uncharacterized protein YaiE (UPF0345 family)